LFADAEGHFTTKGQKIVADYYYSLVIAPSQDLAARRESGQEPFRHHRSDHESGFLISQRTRGPAGFNVWASGDVSRLKVDQPVALSAKARRPRR
jgi:hypothetical protein